MNKILDIILSILIYLLISLIVPAINAELQMLKPVFSTAFILGTKFLCVVLFVDQRVFTMVC